MIKRYSNYIATPGFFLFGALLGWAMFDYEGDVSWLALGPFVVVLWAMSGGRWTAWLVMFGYYLGASRGLFAGGGVFFADKGDFSLSDGLLVWIGPALILSAVWALLWGRDSILFRSFIAIILVAVPPVGIIGWGSPILAAGVWFPGMGLAGLLLMLLTIGLMAKLAQGKQDHYTWWSVTGLVVVSLVCNSIYMSPAQDDWIGVNTDFGDGRKQTSFEGISRLQDSLLTQQSKVSVWPEAAGGWWDVNEAFLSAADDEMKIQKRSALIGAHRVVNGLYVNVVESIGTESGVEWNSRMVVPLSMWRPWASQGEKWAVDWTGSGVKRFQGKKVGVLICYDQVIVWPAILTIIDNPDVLIGVSNGWWSKGTAATGAQMASMGSWARLMGLSMVTARNE